MFFFWPPGMKHGKLGAILQNGGMDGKIKGEISIAMSVDESVSHVSYQAQSAID